MSATHTPLLYITDNGRLLCRRHLGSMALHTGHDLSGLPIEELSAEGAELFRHAVDAEPTCERCEEAR